MVGDYKRLQKLTNTTTRKKIKSHWGRVRSLQCKGGSGPLSYILNPLSVALDLCSILLYSLAGFNFEFVENYNTSWVIKAS